MQGKQNDRNLRGRLSNVNRSLKPIHNRHSYVQNDNIGATLQRLFNRFLSVASFCADGPAGPGLQKIANSKPHYFVIIGDKYSHRGGCRARARGFGGCCFHNLNLQSILIALRRRMKTAHGSRQTLFTAARGNAENFTSARRQAPADLTSMETKLYKEPTAWVATEQWLGWVGLIAQLG